MRPEGVIFDMDGLMFDTERLTNRCYKIIEKEIGFNFSEGMPDMTGQSREVIDKLYWEKYGPNFNYDKIRDRKNRMMRQYVEINGVPIKPGLENLLAFLEQVNIPKVVATSTYETDARFLIEKAGLTRRFNGFVFGNDAKSKPDPDIFLKAAGIMGTTPSKTLVLEDSNNGVEAGINGGFVTIMIPDTKPPLPKIKKSVAACLSSLDDVIPWINS